MKSKNHFITAGIRARHVLTGIVLVFVQFLGPPALEGQTVAFKNVNLIAMTDDQVVPARTVLVRGDRIVEIGPANNIKIPAGAKEIDGEGRFLIPGLGEMHGHNPPPGASEEYVETVYFLFVANGVTTVRSMLGWAGQLELRDKVRRGEMFGPTLHLAGPSFSGFTVKSPAQAEQRVREQKEEGWDLLKVHPGLSRENYNVMVRTAREVDIPFAGHVPADVGLVHALESGQETVDHLDGYIELLEGDRGPLDPEKLQEAVHLTIKHRAGVVPTMRLWETIIGAADLDQMLQYSELKYMPAQEVKNWEETYRRRIGNPNFNQERADRIAANRMVLLKSLQDGGASILFGTDAPQQFSVPGFSIHREMEAMIQAGLTPYQILQSATRNVGEYLKDKDQFGTIEPGSRADLLLLEANPLEDISNVARRTGVMVRGHWLGEEEIQERLRSIANGR